jgi:hypothetical protein
MTNLHLELERESLEVSTRGAVTGRIFFRTDFEAFPDDSWNDFVLVILRWWSEAVAALKDRGSDETELAFMDGPFVVRLRRHGDEEYAADFIDRSRNRVLGHATVQLPDLTQNIVDAAELALRFSEQTTAGAADAEALRGALSLIAPS